MLLSERDQKHRDTMRLVECVSRSLQTISWVWGGYTADIYVGRMLREHDDVDYLTLNLHGLKSEVVQIFSSHGWQPKELENGDLSLKKENIKVHLGNVELGNIARWTHNGEKGALLFPVSWLNADAVEFYGRELHVVAPELQYVLKDRPKLLNPDWLSREKDILDKEYLREILLKRKVDICSLHQLVSSV